MKRLLLKRDYKDQAAALEGEYPDSSNADPPLHENVRVVTTEGKLAAVLLCDVIPPYDRFEIAWILVPFRSRHYESGANQQRPEEFPYRYIETKWSFL